eukprot:4261182-Pyramimonas_sp.AAC.1
MTPLEETVVASPSVAEVEAAVVADDVAVAELEGPAEPALLLEAVMVEAGMVEAAPPLVTADTTTATPLEAAPVLLKEEKEELL